MTGYIAAMRMSFWNRCRQLAMLVIWFAAAVSVVRADTLTWNTNDNRVTADVQSVQLVPLLEGIAKLTGWHIYLESNLTFTASAKFKDLPAGEALRHLLGDLNFALVPQTNSNPKLYVFVSSQRNATMLIHANDLNARASGRTKPIPNELTIRLKPGIKPENINCLQGAKVTGRIESMNSYRIKFENEAAIQAARECLSKNSDVELVDSNYSSDPIDAIQQLGKKLSDDLNLKLKEPSGDCPPIIGLVDTGVPKLGNGLDDFVSRYSVVNSSRPPTGLTHGAAMAETIMRSVQSVTSGSTSVKIVSVDVFGDNETTTTFDLAAGAVAAANYGASVINFSVGSGGDSPLFHQLIQELSQRGIVILGAAGNQPVTTATYPAAYPEVIAVTAGDRDGQIASYANRGPFVDIMTPGTSIVPFDGQSWAVVGTSPATAFASGLTAGLADASKNCPGQVVPTIRSKLGVSFGSQ